MSLRYTNVIKKYESKNLLDVEYIQIKLVNFVLQEFFIIKYDVVIKVIETLFNY